MYLLTNGVAGVVVKEPCKQMLPVDLGNPAPILVNTSKIQNTQHSSSHENAQKAQRWEAEI